MDLNGKAAWSLNSVFCNEKNNVVENFIEELRLDEKTAKASDCFLFSKLNSTPTTVYNRCDRFNIWTCHRILFHGEMFISAIISQLNLQTNNVSMVLKLNVLISVLFCAFGCEILFNFSVFGKKYEFWENVSSTL